jgi:hypothetical protein
MFSLAQRLAAGRRASGRRIGQFVQRGAVVSHEFEYRFQTDAQGRAHADACGAMQGPVGQAVHRHYVDACERNAAPAELHVGGGETEHTTYLVTMDNTARDTVIASKEFAYHRHVPGLQRIAHGGTGNADAIDFDGMHRLHLETMLGASCLQCCQVAAAPLAEAEVVTHHQVARAKTAQQDIDDKRFGGYGRNFSIEAQDMGAVDAGLLQQGQLLAQAGEPGGGFLMEKKFARMRLESKHGRGQTARTGTGDQRVEHGAMPQMQAVEIADGQRRGTR